jgi:ATP-dependent Lon protease
MKATDINGIGTLEGLELGVFVSLVSGLTKRPVQNQMCVLGSMSIGGTIIPTSDLAGALQIAQDAGAKTHFDTSCRYDKLLKGSC